MSTDYLRRPVYSQRSSSPTRARCAGFTLLEVALAVLVLGTTLVALTKMLTLGRLLADTDAKRVEALSILRNEAALIGARGYDSLEDEATASVEGHPGFVKTVAIQDLGDGMRQVDITVSWTSPTGESAAESVSFLVGQTILPARSWEVP